jgi:hypothetical protein
MPIRGSSWFAKRGGKRVLGGNHVNWAGEEEGQTIDCKEKNKNRRVRKVERRRKREEEAEAQSEAEMAEWDEE